jgi:hypothetical protein
MIMGVTTTSLTQKIIMLEDLELLHIMKMIKKHLGGEHKLLKLFDKVWCPH